MSEIERRAFDETKVKRGTGAAGGQFASKGGPQKATRPGAPARKGRPGGGAGGGGNLSFDGKRGTGYGVAGGDKRVKSLQAALNRLGMTDSSGKELKTDGKLGPKTTAAIKKAQRALGLKPDGVVTPALLRKLTTSRALLKPGKPASASARKGAKAAPAKKAPAKKAAAAPKRPTTKGKTPSSTNSSGPPRRGARAVDVGRAVLYSGGMDETTRHYPGRHNQGSHGNRLGKPTNIAGKTGLGKATAALADKPEQGPERAPERRDLSSASARKAAYEEYKNLSRDDFNALPEDRKAEILDDLRRINKLGKDQLDSQTGRGSYGTKTRGQAEHVVGASFLLSSFQRPIEPKRDTSPKGRAATLKAVSSRSEASAALYGASKRDMESIAQANGWGGWSSGWKVDKFREFLIKKALEG